LEGRLDLSWFSPTTRLRIASYFTPDIIIPLACHRADLRTACSQWAKKGGLKYFR